MTEPTSSPPQRRIYGLRRMHLLMVCALGLAGAAHGGPFELTEGTIDGGGQHSQGQRFALEGSIGQSDAGVVEGTRFSIDGGFWRPAIAPLTDTIFSHGFED